MSSLCCRHCLCIFAGLLLNNLSVYHGCEIVFDSSEVPDQAMSVATDVSDVQVSSSCHAAQSHAAGAALLVTVHAGLYLSMDMTGWQDATRSAAHDSSCECLSQDTFKRCDSILLTNKLPSFD